MNSYNEISYRYVKVNTEFYIPHTFRLQDTQNKQSSCGAFDNADLLDQYKKSLEASYATYTTMLEAGVCREQARAILPVATYTEFIFTCNLHSLMHFFKLRLGSGAQKEIRAYAQVLLVLALPHFPITLEAWRKKYIPEAEWIDEIKEIAKWTEQLG